MKVRMLVTAVLAALAGCTDRPHALDIEIAFDPPELRDQVVRVEIAIHEGQDCATAPVLVTRVVGAPPSGDLPLLGSGAHSFAARAVDETCRVIVSAPCVNRTLPLADGGRVTLTLGVPESIPLCAPSDCTGGVCGDAGISDGGVSDADGQCAIDCGTSTCCSGTCRDLAHDPDNCTACGARCPDWQHSVPTCNGRCVRVCDPGPFFATCTGSESDGCTDLRESDNCGACGVRCDPDSGTPVCGPIAADLYGCVADCPMGTTPCDSSCADLLRDPGHCGSCDTDCGEAGCDEGTCRCPATASLQCPVDGGGYTCHDGTTSPENCGTCGRACGLRMDCVGSICRCEPMTCPLPDGGCTSRTLDDGGCGPIFPES